MGFVVFRRRKERLVGGDERDAARISKLDQGGLRHPLGRHAVALQFDIEPVAEQPLQDLAARQRERALAADDRRVERPVRTAAERDQAGGFAVEPSELDVRLLLRRRIEIGARAKPHQAAIALFGGGQKHDAPARRRRARIAALEVAEVDRQRAADDRLDAGVGQFLGKFERTEHIVGVGESERRLAVLLGQLGEPRHRQRAFEQRIGRMDVQMNEAGLGHGRETRWLRSNDLARFSTVQRWPRATLSPQFNAPGSRSQNAQHLRPYRQSSQEKAERSQRQSLLDNRANHVSPLPSKKNETGT